MGALKLEAKGRLLTYIKETIAGLGLSKILEDTSCLYYGYLIVILFNFSGSIIT